MHFAMQHKVKVVCNTMVGFLALQLRKLFSLEVYCAIHLLNELASHFFWEKCGMDHSGHTWPRHQLGEVPMPSGPWLFCSFHHLTCNALSLSSYSVQCNS